MVLNSHSNLFLFLFLANGPIVVVCGVRYPAKKLCDFAVIPGVEVFLHSFIVLKP